MQFNFDCEQTLGCNPEGFAVLEGSFQTAIKPGYIPFVNEILDSMGFASSKAQALNTIITSASKFFSSNHRIYIRAQGNSVIGLLKVGVKKLFVRDELANYHEISPLCVLDFYVHESQQRGGHGKSLFEFMLKFENVQPKLLAYDRPSSKLLGFLNKHYNLNSYVNQNNNYVVFNEYFEHLKYEKELKQSNRGSSRSNSQPQGFNSFNSYTNNTSLANFGQQLISSAGVNINNNNNVESNQRQTPNKMNNYNNTSNQMNAMNNADNNTRSSNTYYTPNKVFSNYFFNGQNTNYYDQIYSKKKLNLLNDYLATNPKQPDEYVKSQLEFREKEILQAKGRVRQLENNITSNNSNVHIFNKRNEYSTVFDDKKLLEKRMNEGNNINTMNNMNRNLGLIGANMQNQGLNNNFNTYNNIANQIYSNNQYLNNNVINTGNNYNYTESQTSRRTPVKTNVMPTTNLAYGAYYNNYDPNNKIIYY